jgi:hypothetical protein
LSTTFSCSEILQWLTKLLSLIRDEVNPFEWRYYVCIVKERVLITGVFGSIVKGN